MEWIRREERIVREARDGKLSETSGICAEDRRAITVACAERREMTREDARTMLGNLKAQRKRARKRYEARRELAPSERDESPLLMLMGESDDGVARNLEGDGHKVIAWWNGVRFLIPYDAPDRYTLASEWFAENDGSWQVDYVPGWDADRFDARFDAPREGEEELPF